MNKKILLVAGLMLCIGICANAQMCIVDSGKAKAVIVCPQDSKIDLEAARTLNIFIERISGTTLDIVPSSSKSKGKIILGKSTTEVGYDGFVIECKDGNLHILNGGGKGSIYGVVTVLERYLGVSYYAKDCYYYTNTKDVNLPAFRDVETPAFRYRQTQGYGSEDPMYHNWFRLRTPDEVFVNNMWVHTFEKLLPSNKYGKTHPEYYSYINGERRPGNHSQWCLTNPEVFEVVATRLDSIFRANPELKMISVSQNDGNNTQCACPECKAVEEYEGSPSGNFIRFLNKLAERFPDKEFSTLAYLFTMQPPQHVKPLPNVNIMLCDIDCMREVPLTDNATGKEFMKALEGWSAISNNIFVWDYGINFDNMVSPFPNFHILQKNLQLFKKNHATMVFEQVNGTRGTDFSELRAYMIGKLMWNPDADADALMKTFLKGYYADAAPYLYQYLKVMEGALLASGTPLWIYDSPVTHKNGMLNTQLRKVYNELFDQAESAVKEKPEFLERVRLSRLPLQYAELEISRTEGNGDRNDLIEKVKLFKERTAEYGVLSYTERNNSPQEYCDLYLDRFLPGGRSNIASGAKVIWNNPPAPRYKPIAETALTDALYGGTTYVESWIGWEGEDADFILDMGEIKEFSVIDTDFLHQLGAWILLPKSVEYSISCDGKEYENFGRVEFAEDRDIRVKFCKAEVKKEQKVRARYIRVKIETLGLCPSWHYGVGYPAWFFIDEVMVN